MVRRSKSIFVHEIFSTHFFVCFQVGNHIGEIVRINRTKNKPKQIDKEIENIENCGNTNMYRQKR